MFWHADTATGSNLKFHNHWKILIQVLILDSEPFMHNNIINFFISYFPGFCGFRKNEAKKKWVGCVNFMTDFILTTPLLFICFTFYQTGLYIVLPIGILLTYLLPLLNKTPNITLFGNNPRRTIVPITERKFKFTFLNYQLSIIFLLISFAILFCDTTLFDDSLSKTTKDGIGTMDLGAGLILFTSGITSRQARGMHSN
jgi:hypothetical protein